jgi:predicted ribonuclease toxin of YeeF-YezG toxin-antitoxin module
MKNIFSSRMVVAYYSANANLKFQSRFVMRVLEEREIKQLNSPGKNAEHVVAEPPRSLFKVVVNNYRQHEKSLEKQKDQIGETMMSDQQSLPPQPAGYLKFPEYDWF